MLKRVSIANVATFSGDTQVFGDLRKVNFVYGANGSGKTTISRIIAHPERHTACSTTWEGDLSLSAFVYNRDFVDEHFKLTDPIKGIFTLGTGDEQIRASISEKLEQINKCDDSIKHATANLKGDEVSKGKIQELQELEEAIEEYCWESIKKPYDTLFQKAFEGLRNNKKRFAESCLNKFTPQASSYRDKEALIAEAETVFKDNVELHESYKIPNTKPLISNLQSGIYTLIIVGGKDIDIAEMISKLENSDWVRQGQQQLAQSAGKCPFCQQTLPDNFATKLNRYFDETFTANIIKLKQAVEDGTRLLDGLVFDINRLVESEDDSFIDKAALKIAKQAFDAKVSLIKKCLEEKSKEPSRSITMPLPEEELKTIVSIVGTANEKIEKHNTLVRNLAAARKALIEDIWCFLIEENRAILSEKLLEKNNINKAIEGLNQTINDQNTRKGQLWSEMLSLQKQLTSVKPTIDAINAILDSFGFTSFRLGPDGEANYKLQRLDGTDVGNTLSEGEKTFVTFLYFYHLLKGGISPDQVSENRIVVIDDPVSSLDANILFIVSSLIRECIADICNNKGYVKQIIVLTHNVYFFKEITFTSGRKGDNSNEWTYWIVRKDNNISSVRKELTNPIRTSYELLWREIQEPGISKIGIQNAMRRIIEYYFKLLGGVSQETIESKFSGVDRIVCKSLFSWMNDGSHSIDDDLHYQVVDAEIDTYRDVFRHVFIDNGHSGHYEMMMQNVCEKPELTTATVNSADNSRAQ